MGSICIRNTNLVQASLNNNKQANIGDKMYQKKNSLSSTVMQYDDIFIRHDSMNVNDQQWTFENRDDRKWHDDLIYS